MTTIQIYNNEFSIKIAVLIKNKKERKKERKLRRKLGRITRLRTWIDL